jgi:hypothetical protein
MVSCATDTRVLQEPTLADRVEQRRKKVTRVAKSSLAAIASSLSAALDKHLYARLLCHALMHGESGIGPDWRQTLKIPGFIVTDASNPYDHMITTGSLPAQRATMLDLLAAKDMIEQGLATMRWVPTQHRYADHLTKMMTCELNRRYLEQGRVYLIQTADDAVHEEKKAELRRGRMQKRKLKMKNPKASESQTAGAAHVV